MAGAVGAPATRPEPAPTATALTHRETTDCNIYSHITRQAACEAVDNIDRTLTDAQTRRTPSRPA